MLALDAPLPRPLVMWPPNWLVYKLTSTRHVFISMLCVVHDYFVLFNTAFPTL